jgi:hypothetical protein
LISFSLLTTHIKYKICNTMNLELLWCSLPRDIVNYILLFDNVIRYRRGKYINQISNSNSSNIYDLLLKIPQPIIDKYTLINSNVVYKMKICFYNQSKNVYFLFSFMVLITETKETYVTPVIFEKLAIS